MASRALMQRFSSAFSSWLTSTSVAHRPVGADNLHLDLRPHRAADQVLQAGDEPVEVGGAGIERLPAREGEQAMGERGGARGALLGRLEEALDVLRAPFGDALAHALQRAARSPAGDC